MWRYLFQKLVLAIPIVLAVVAFVFLAIRLVPGDPAVIMAGDFADEATLERMRSEWGLDRSLPVQLGVFVSNLARGDLGKSIRSRQPVTTELARRLTVTLTLAIGGIGIAVALGLAAGIIGAVKPYTAWDYASTIAALIGVSMPIFWSGLLLIILFSLQLGWFPTGGIGSWQHYVLPAVSLGVFSAGVIARQTRSSMLGTLAQDFVRTAKAKGLHPRSVILKHALRASLIPIVTITGLQLGRMLAGAILTETVFNLPGLGSYLVTAIAQRDYPVIQGIVLLFALMFTLVNLLTDLTYPFLDPQVSNR
jgi:peptide/nickel transport system permease protein/oligopeptide transport system permease protein